MSRSEEEEEKLPFDESVSARKKMKVL